MSIVDLQLLCASDYQVGVAEVWVVYVTNINQSTSTFVSKLVTTFNSEE